MSYDIFSDLPKIAHTLLCEPWMILPARHQSMVAQLEAHRALPPEMRQEKMEGKKKEKENID